jgi:hypothetical protein
MWHAHAGFRLCLFFHKTCCYIFLMFYNYTIFRLMRCLHVNRNLITYIVWQNAVQIIYRFTWKYFFYFFICVYLKGFCKLAIRKICMSSLFSPVKKRNILCSGEHVKWSVKCIVRVFHSAECLCGILHIRFTVGCQMLTLYCMGGRDGGSRNMSGVPRCRFIVLNMHLQ